MWGNGWVAMGVRGSTRSYSALASADGPRCSRNARIPWYRIDGPVVRRTPTRPRGGSLRPSRCRRPSGSAQLKRCASDRKAVDPDLRPVAADGERLQAEVVDVLAVVDAEVGHDHRPDDVARQADEHERRRRQRAGRGTVDGERELHRYRSP